MASLSSSKSTICNVCNENFSISDPGLRPRILTTCGHSNCTNCCEILIKNGNITCPACYAVTVCDDANSLPQNWLAIEVLDSAETSQQQKSRTCTNPDSCSNDATVYCRNCDMEFCDKCATAVHQQHPLLKIHQMGPLSARKPMCSVHEDCAAEFYCKTDKQLVCYKCVAVGKHKNHDVMDVEDVAGGVRNELNLESQKANRLLSSIEKREQELDRDEKDVESSLTRSLLQALKDCDELIDHVASRKKQIEQEVFKVKETKLGRCEVMKQLLANSKFLLTKVKSDCEANMNDFEVLACHVGVKERLMEAEDITKQALLEERITTRAQYDKSILKEMQKMVSMFGNINVPAAPVDLKVINDVKNRTLAVEWSGVKFDRKVSAYQVQVKKRLDRALNNGQETGGAAAEEEGEEEVTKGDMCPSNHPLECFKTPKKGFSCNGCGKKNLPKNTSMFRCHPCKYNVCQQCWLCPNLLPATGHSEEEVYEEVYNGIDTAVVLKCSDFELNTLYSFRVRAMSGSDCGEWSKEVSIKTPDTPPTIFDDSVILAPEAAKHNKELLKMFKQPKEALKLKLLYRGSRDGFKAVSFHAKCDAATRTLTVVRSTNGYISGGYAGASWRGSRQYTHANNNWLFSLHPTPLKLLCSEPGCAQYCHPGYGPTFGDGHDMCITNAMTSNGNYSNPSSYTTNDPLYPNTILTNSTLFGTARNLTVAEIEVFEVVF